MYFSLHHHIQKLGVADHLRVLEQLLLLPYLRLHFLSNKHLVLRLSLFHLGLLLELLHLRLSWIRIRLLIFVDKRVLKVVQVCLLILQILLVLFFLHRDEFPDFLVVRDCYGVFFSFVFWIFFGFTRLCG